MKCHGCGAELKEWELPEWAAGISFPEWADKDGWPLACDNPECPTFMREVTWICAPVAAEDMEWSCSFVRL